MGTIISLDIAGMSLTWSKNDRGRDHGFLFQPEDRKPLKSDQIDYNYFARSGEDPGSMEMAFARPLRLVVPRLELLGYTIHAARTEYEARVESWREERVSIHDEEPEPLPEPLSFKEFCALATRHAVHDLDDSMTTGFDEQARRQMRGRFADDALVARIPGYEPFDQNAYSERSYFGGLVGILRPYSVLRVLAGNPDNLKTDLVWQYGPLVDGGWASEAEFVPNARRTQTFLIATEGSSDAHILKHALALLRPEIADFFRFIDVSERHPFSGTGNLLKFAEGLVKIDIQNQIVFLFDNDAESYEAFLKLQKLAIPANMRGQLLPELEDFRTFPARGPEGVGVADINRRAAAIECYLDLRLAGYPAPRVVWTNFKKEINCYQGALEHKESYTRAFLALTPEHLASGSYDVTRISLVLDSLVAECSALVGLTNSSAPARG